jgi:multidrug efflux pump subunit AcrA (membrane-fusion protein)
VPQAFSAGLAAGEKVTFDMPQYPGQHFDAALVTTSRAMDANSRSMTVELQADNADGKFAAGTYAQVHFPISVDPNTLIVPATALMPVDHGVEVAVIGDSGKAVFKTVQLGRDFGDRVEVVAGLASQDRVIDSPPETLQSGDAVQFAAALTGDKKR